VNNTHEFIHTWWIKAQLKAPPFVQRTVIPRLHEAKEIIRLLARPYLPVCQLQGQGQGGPLTVTYAGLAYAKPFLIDLLFAEKPTEQIVGRIPFWRYDQLVTLSSSDMVIVEAAEHLVRRLPCQNAIVIPQLIDHVVDVRGDWKDVRSRFHETVRKNELRWIRKYGYEYDLSHDSQDFEEFYYQMYLPTMQSRHGELSSPLPIGEAHQYFRHGWLFMVKRDGDWVSGVSCHLEQDVLVAVISGVKNADAQLIHEGATAATYYAAIHWANQHGCTAVNFRGSGARLIGGLFQHKRKWGTTVSIPPRLHRQIWIRARRNTPAVSRFLKESPFAVIGKDGKLHGLIILDDPYNAPAEMKQEWEARFATPGLSSLIVRSVHSFIEEPERDDIPERAISIPPPSEAEANW
jgi:hypothetical protein